MPYEQYRLKTDIELMEMVKSGNEEAFAVLVDRYANPIINFIFRMIGNKEESEELSQETFLRLYKSATSYSPKAKFSTFLFTIATNVALTELKHARRHYYFHSLDEQLQKGEKNITLSDVIPSSSPNPYEEHLTKECVEEIEKAIHSLPKELYLVYTLTEDEGLSYEEAAKVVKIPRGTVASRKNTAVKILREKLAHLYPRQIQGGKL